MKKTLILVRHAHRDTSERDLDNGLSDKGREQAKAIRKFFASRFGPAELANGLWLVSSPKKRCQQTLDPIAKLAGSTLDIHPDLNEQKPKESAQEFDLRVQKFLNEWSKNKAGISVVCSHGDWLPIAIFQILGTSHEMKKGSWFELEWNSQKPNLKWYIPSFKKIEIN